MNEVERALLHAVTSRLRPLGQQLVEAGWRAEVVIFAPEEIKRIPGYKVALIVQLSDPMVGATTGEET